MSRVLRRGPGSSSTIRLSAGAVLARNGAHAAQLATKAWSAMCEGLVRPWPPCLKGRAMRPRVTSSASSRSADAPTMRANASMRSLCESSKASFNVT